MFTWACPARSLTTLAGKPSISRWPMWGCRSPWNVIGVTFAEATSRRNALVSLSASIGLPSGRANTSPRGSRLGPNFHRDSSCSLRCLLKAWTVVAGKEIVRRLVFVFGDLNANFLWCAQATAFSWGLHGRKDRVDQKKSPVSSYFVEVPEVLKSVSFIGHQKIPEHVRVGFCPIWIWCRVRHV